MTAPKTKKTIAEPSAVFYIDSMFSNLQICAAQINPIVGDVSGNTQRMQDIWAAHPDIDLVLFPETCICGYPADDLVLKPAFMKQIDQNIAQLVEFSKTINAPAYIPTPWLIDGQLYNAALLIEKGNIRQTILKHELPNYGIFDDKRHFKSGALGAVVELKGRKVGMMICEDIWLPNVSKHLKSQGAECLIAANASHFEVHKQRRRIENMHTRIRETGLPLLYLNMIGGQDELVFDGGSMAFDADGEIIWQPPAFQEYISIVRTGDITDYPPDDQAMYTACVMGLRDYILKNKFRNVLLGLSGGIDSALVTAMAVDALGAEHVRCIMLPSVFTSPQSLEDAKACAAALKTEYDIIPIENMVKSAEDSIPKIAGLAHENMQSRLRGLTLMSLSNMSGEILLSTGNKSEIAVGYATIYGDMCGGYNPLKDVYKTKVYDLANLRNRWKPHYALGPDGRVIPQAIIDRAPSAELRPDQKDQDSLPPYPVLDAILEQLIEHDRSVDDLIADGFDTKTVHHINKLLKNSEYKRKQAAPGPKVTAKSFALRDRRYPITNGF